MKRKNQYKQLLDHVLHLKFWKTKFLYLGFSTTTIYIYIQAGLYRASGIHVTSLAQIVYHSEISCQPWLSPSEFWLLWLLSCETAGIFEIINELCNPSNSCTQAKSFSSAHYGWITSHTYIKKTCNIFVYHIKDDFLPNQGKGKLPRWLKYIHCM